MKPITDDPIGAEMKRWMRSYLHLGDRSSLGAFASVAGPLRPNRFPIFVPSTALAITFAGKHSTMPACVAITCSGHGRQTGTVFSRS